MTKRYLSFLPSVFIFSVALVLSASAGSNSVVSLEQEEKNLWTYEFGAAFMTENTIAEILTGTINRDDTDSGAEIYQITATRFLNTLPVKIGGQTYYPHLEMPLCLEVVDESSRDPFLNYSASLQIRWVDFPWNHKVRTAFAAGLGLSYSEKIYLNDIRFHQNQERSYLKFNIPVSLTFSCPSYPDQELVIYIAHHSGGFGILDHGGINSLGMGIRSKF